MDVIENFEKSINLALVYFYCQNTFYALSIKIVTFHISARSLMPTNHSKIVNFE